MELTKVTGRISQVEDDDEDPVMALWRMENEARAATCDTTATDVEAVGR